MSDLAPSSGSNAALLSVIDTVVADQSVAATPDPAPDAATPEVAAPVADTPDPAAPAPDPTPTTLADDALVEVLVDGQPQRMTWAEARKGVMMQSAFTKKTQALARDREQAQQLQVQAQQAAQQAAQLQQQVMQILQDPAKLSAVYMALQARQQGQPQALPAQPPQPSFDPTAFRQQVVQEALQTIAFKQQEASIESDVTTFTTSLIADEPILSTVPGFIDKVYEEVAQMKPESTEQAKEYIRLYIEGTKGKLHAALGTVAKTAAVAKAKAAAATIPGGSVVTPTAKKYTHINEMEADIFAELDRLIPHAG